MIKLENLTEIYNKGGENQLVALDNVSLEIGDGEMVAVMGKSGSGKSTLLKIIAGLLSATDGKCVVNGADVCKLSEKELSTYRNKTVGIVLQDFLLVENLSVQENVALPLLFSKKPEKNYKTTVVNALKKVGIYKFANKNAGLLSGGEKQRTAIARAVINGPDIILADEPTGALDSENSETIMNIFKELNDEGKTVIIVTHDTGVAERCARTIRLHDGKITD